MADLSGCPAWANPEHYKYWCDFVRLGGGSGSMGTFLGILGDVARTAQPSAEAVRAAERLENVFARQKYGFIGAILLSHEVAAAQDVARELLRLAGKGETNV